MKSILTVLLLTLFTIMTTAQPVQQTIGANGFLTSEIFIFAENDLEFGLMTRGEDNVISVADLEAGQFIMSIEEVGEIVLAFTLPTHMTNGSGGLVPLSFSETSAGYSGENQNGQQATLFNPNTPTPIYFHNANQDWRIYIGGTATPGVDAPTGGYTAEIILSAEYN